MAEGILAEVENGFARIQFLDASKRGPALAKLIELGGPELIDIDTRSNPRKTYIVPESIAAEAGLLEDAPSLLVVPPYPEGEPNDSWTVPQLRAYAGARGISLGEATKKADILLVLTGTPPTE